MLRRKLHLTAIAPTVAFALAAAGPASAAAPTLDPTFGTGGVVTFAPGPSATITGLIVLPDGKILVGSRASGKGFVLARYLANGTLDPTFGSAGVANHAIGTGGNLNDVALQGNRIVATGNTGNGTDFVPTVARFTYDGALDTTFNGPTGYYQAPATTARDVSMIAVQPDEKIIVGGSAPAGVQGPVLLRFKADGSGLDSTFDGDGVAIAPGNIGGCGIDASAGATSVVPTSAGIIVGAVCGGTNATFEHTTVLRFHAGASANDGALDTTFGTGGVSTLVLTPGKRNYNGGIAVQSDGRVVANVQDGSGGPTSALLAARWNTDGTPDASFGTGGVSAPFGFTDAQASSEGSIVIAPDGRIYLIGTKAPTLGGFGIARFRAPGVLDPLWGEGGTFIQPFGDPGGPFQIASEPLRLALQTDGKLLVGGFALQGGTNVTTLMRFIPPAEPQSPASMPTPTPAPVAAKPTFAQVMTLPSTRRCASRRLFRIRLRKLNGVTYRSASVSVNGRRVKLVKGKRLTAPVDLRGLPSGRVVVKVTVTLADGTRLTGKRTYRTCVAKRRGRKATR